MQTSKIFLIIFGCISVLLYLNISSCNKPADNTSADYLTFPSELTPQTPYDVDTTLVKQLLAKKNLPGAQRLFDILSWQMFLSLNWPLDNRGNYLPDITDDGARGWEDWKESFEVFKDDGGAPLAWGSKTDLPLQFKGKINEKGHEDVLFRTSKFAIFKGEKWKRKKGGGRSVTDKADEVNQAFTAPIWDQNGNVVHYEIRLNKKTVDYIVHNELYNLDGQIAFSNAKNSVSFPKGNRASEGTVELKFAWKIIVAGVDDISRYFTKKAYVLEKDGKFKLETVGLVGMHIGTRTESSPQWIWATFEQVDNLETNLLQVDHGKPLRPSFYNPDCETCPVNLLPDTNQKLIRNQIQRVLPIPVATQELNKQVQAVLKKKKSFWQYYQLIGTQWPTDPFSKPYPLNASTYHLPEAVANKSGGKPEPVYLTNMIMETYFQGGTIVGSGNTPSIYNKYLGNEPAFFQIEGGPQDVDTLNTRQMIFGTEGCMSCHSSSSIAIRDTFIDNKRYPKFGPPRTADFEWLLQLKAHFKTPKVSSSKTK